MTALTHAQRESLRGTREVRSGTSDLETRSASGQISFRGYASVSGVSYDLGAFSEKVQRGAFTKTLSERPDVMLLANHEGLPIARTTIPAGQPGSLILTEDDLGLAFSATADADDPDAKSVHNKIKRGLMTECSFAFRVVRDAWSTDGDQRTLQEVNLNRGDVSVVNYGASPTTSVSVRSLLAQRGIHTPADGRPLAYYQGILRRHQLYAEFSDRLRK